MGGKQQKHFSLVVSILWVQNFKVSLKYSK